MIDLRTLRENPEAVRASQRARGEDESLVDALLSADERRRAAVSRADSLRAEQKALGKQVGRAQGDERAALLAKGKELAAEVKAAEAEQAEADAALVDRARSGSRTSSRTACPRAARTTTWCSSTSARRRSSTSSRATTWSSGEWLRRDRHGARREGLRRRGSTSSPASARSCRSALLNMAVQQAVEAGFTPMITPSLVRPEIMEGTGFLGAHASEVYRLRDDDLFLVGTSEVPLAGYHTDEILDLSDGPKRYAGWSSCYRREAGSYGKDTRGIIRVHQFDKVEMFSYCPPEQAADEHQRLLAWEEEMLAKVELPYRVIDTAAGDLGSSAARKYDCEAWVPTQQTYREVTSTSNCTTFQARRLNIRYRDADGKPQTLPRSTARWRRPAGSSRSWRTTSRPTARCGCPRRCVRTSGARGADSCRTVTG